MQDQPAPSQDGATPFTLREAAEVLGISLNTLRRRIAAGQVRAERVQRPQGHVWQVYLHGAATQEHRAAGTIQQDGAGTAQQPPTAIMQAEAMAAYTRSLLEPLVQTIERQADRVAELERENGRQSAELERAASIAVKLSDELDAARAQISTLTASTTATSPEPTNGAVRTSRAHPVALVGTPGAHAGYRGRRRDGAAGVAAVNLDTLALIGAAVLVAGVVLLVLWLWWRGGPHSKDPRGSP